MPKWCAWAMVLLHPLPGLGHLRFLAEDRTALSRHAAFLPPLGLSGLAGPVASWLALGHGACLPLVLGGALALACSEGSRILLTESARGSQQLTLLGAGE